MTLHSAVNQLGRILSIDCRTLTFDDVQVIKREETAQVPGVVVPPEPQIGAMTEAEAAQEQEAAQEAAAAAEPQEDAAMDADAGAEEDAAEDDAAEKQPSGPVKLGYKTFQSSDEMLSYFKKLLQTVERNVDLNEVRQHGLCNIFHALFQCCLCSKH
jgi:hypothetical protein